MSIFFLHLIQFLLRNRFFSQKKYIFCGHSNFYYKIHKLNDFLLRNTLTLDNKSDILTKKNCVKIPDQKNCCECTRTKRRNKQQNKQIKVDSGDEQYNANKITKSNVGTLPTLRKENSLFTPNLSQFSCVHFVHIMPFFVGLQIFHFSSFNLQYESLFRKKTDRLIKIVSKKGTAKRCASTENHEETKIRPNYFVECTLTHTEQHKQQQHFVCIQRRIS